MPVHEPIRLMAAGDICPGDHFSMGFGIGSLARSHGCLFPFRYVRDILHEGDIVFGNCEGVVSDIGADPKNIDTMEFRGSPEFARALRDCGFTAVSVGNNHTGEHGLLSLRDTVTNLRSSGIEIVGLRGKNRTAEPLIQDVKGLRVGWLAYTWIVSRHVDQDSVALSWTRGEEVAREIAALRPDVDFLIVSAHWGREFVPVPPQSVIDQAHAMADAGADLLLGHHPHVLQGTEQYGRCLIIYSLGNFLFDMWQPRLRDTALFHCWIEGGRIQNFDFIPVKINRRFQPMPATGTQADRIRGMVAQRTAAIKDPHLSTLRNDIKAAKLEADFKRKIFWGQLFYLLLLLFRMGPRVAYQKLCRRLPSSWQSMMPKSRLT